MAAVEESISLGSVLLFPFPTLTILKQINSEEYAARVKRLFPELDKKAADQIINSIRMRAEWGKDAFDMDQAKADLEALGNDYFPNLQDRFNPNPREWKSFLEYVKTK